MALPSSRLPLVCSLIGLLAVSGVAARGADPSAAARWWQDIEALASDDMQGRETGTPEYRRAAEYVARAFEASGLTPAGTDGYYQPVRFVSRQFVPGASTLTLVREGAETPILVGDEAVIGLRYAPAESVDAPLVFAGYGLSIPDAGHDDLAGLDVKGKVVVYMSGTPDDVPDNVLVHAQSAAERWAPLARAGAVGLVAISPASSRDMPWERVVRLSSSRTLRLADSAFDEAAGQQIGVTVNERGAAKLLEGSSHEFESLAALASRHAALPRFPLGARLRVHLAVAVTAVSADNVAGVLRGSDPSLADEYVVLSAHLDHVGIGEPIDGDRIYNGAMDNASGIATLLETARRYRARGTAPKRSLVFLAVTAEEQGLLGSRYWVTHPTVARGSIVANVNVDMFLPLYPMRSVIGYGAEESDLGDDLARAAAAAGVSVMTDPEPARRSFIRSDQYSFIRAGVPALALKLGYELNSPEHEVVKEFRAKRYHAPSDDLAQPFDRGAAAAFNDLYAALADSIANRAARPAWKPQSFFRQFVSESP